MEIDDAYLELGLTAGATEAEVKAAWRRLAARWHPDRNDSPYALHKMQRINRAWEEIRNFRFSPDVAREDEERDSEKHARTQSEGAGRPPRDDVPPSSEEASSQAEERQGRPQRLLHHVVRLTLEEAVFGCIKELHGEVVDECLECGATGEQVLSGGCRQCSGTGRVQRPAWFGWLASWADCEACGGEGIAKVSCHACHGRGKTLPRKYACQVRIPPGVRDGDTLHAPAPASLSDGQDKEALSILVELLPHELFELDPEGGTLRCEVPVDGFAWMANRWIEVPTPSGLQQMRLDRNHRLYRLRGQGFPAERGGPRGDCLITVVPLFPQEFSPEQEMLLDRLISTNSRAPGSHPGDRLSAWEQALQDWKVAASRPGSP